MKKNKTMLLLCIVCFYCIFVGKCEVSAESPLELCLELQGESMKQGEKMDIGVSLGNYDETNVSHVITTIIVEVSFNTDVLEVNPDSIEVTFDKGKKGIAIGHMHNESNVELQYLNISEPLKKGTKQLYHFQIKALKDIQQLQDYIKITYAIFQDGTLEVSKEWSVSPCVIVNGQVLKQGYLEEKYLSNYGTIFENIRDTEEETQKSTGETDRGSSVVNIENKEKKVRGFAVYMVSILICVGIIRMVRRKHWRIRCRLHWHR